MYSSDVHKRLRDNFQATFEEGRDVPIERSTQQFMVLASGRLDALSGCYIFVRDDMADLMRRTDEIQRDNLYVQRRIT